MRQLTFSFFFIALLALTALIWASFSDNHEQAPIRSGTKPLIAGTPSREFTKLHSKAFDAKRYCRHMGFDTSVCFLIDMSLPANRKRFFIYDLRSDTVFNAGLVTHGNCNQYWLDGRKYGNDMGCGCTSLGRYKIGKAYQGRFGLAFKLYGLDSANSNAFRRFVVLHSHSCVPEKETEEDICQSNGCPTVSPFFLRQLEPLIKNAPAPILLWIFN